MSLQLLIKDVEDQMLQWLEMKRTIYEALTVISAEMDSHTKNVRVVQIGGGSLGIIGGTMAIVGFALSFATFGGSLALTVAGASIAATGGLTAGGSSMAEKYLHSKLRKQALENLNESKDFLTDFSSNIEDVTNLLVPKTEEAEHRLPKCSILEEPEEEDDGYYAEAGSYAVTGTKVVAKGANFTNNLISVGQAGQIAITATTSALAVVGGVVNIILLPLDVYNVVQTAMALHKSLPHDASTLIRTIASEFDSENEMDTETIEMKFAKLQTLTLTDIPNAVIAWEELCQMMSSTQVNIEHITANLDLLLKKAKKKGLNVDSEIAKMHAEMNDDEKKLLKQIEKLNAEAEVDRKRNNELLKKERDSLAEEDSVMWKQMEEMNMSMESVNVKNLQKAKDLEAARQKQEEEELHRQIQEINRLMEEDIKKNENAKAKIRQQLSVSSTSDDSNESEGKDFTETQNEMKKETQDSKIESENSNKSESAINVGDIGENKNEIKRVSQHSKSENKDSNKSESATNVVGENKNQMKRESQDSKIENKDSNKSENVINDKALEKEVKKC